MNSSITEVSSANPIQAALTPAATFTIGALPCSIAASLDPQSGQHPHGHYAMALLVLAALGAIGARTFGGASLLKGTLRVLIWSALAMATYRWCWRAIPAQSSARAGPWPPRLSQLLQIPRRQTQPSPANQLGQLLDARRRYDRRRFTPGAPATHASAISLSAAHIRADTASSAARIR